MKIEEPLAECRWEGPVAGVGATLSLVVMGTTDTCSPESIRDILLEHVSYYQQARIM